MLSVVIPCYNAEKTIKTALSSLLNQKTDKDFEVIVVDSSFDRTAEIIKQNYPWVKLYTFPERKFCGDARNIGISKARGDIIAFFDADCIAESNWVEEILKAHQMPHLVIGGVVGNGNPESLVSWAYYFCECNLYMPNTKQREVDDLPGLTVSYKKKVFEEYDHFVEGVYGSDTELNARIRKDGHRLLCIPSILVYHIYLGNLKEFLKHEYIHGQSYARMRVETAYFSRLKRFCYAVCFPLIAAKLFLRAGLLNMKNQIYLPHYLKSLPLIASGFFFWSLGEAVGYAKGKIERTC
jgi:glycosyltransferase involved in cell wall biosynthesis